LLKVSQIIGEMSGSLRVSREWLSCRFN